MPRFTLVVLVAAIFVLAWQLMLPPVVGVANNGDFGKLLGQFGLGSPTEHEAAFADTQYEFDSRYYYRSGFSSSESILVRAALGLSSVLSKDTHFDVRYMGVIHSSLFLLAVFLFVPLLKDLPNVAQYALGAFVLLVFGDVAYVSYLNSFYMDVAAFLFFLLTAVSYVRVLRWHRPGDFALLIASIVLLVTSKPQHASLGILIAILLTTNRRAVWPKAQALPIAAGVAIALVSMLALSRFSPREYQAQGCFTVIFYQVLPHSKNPGQTLADLGLEEAWMRHLGQHAYSEGGLGEPAVASEFGRRVSYFRLGLFFLTHPRDGYIALHDSLSQAGRQRPGLGNFDSASGMKPWQESQSFALWSGWKRAAFFHRGTRYLLCFLLLATGTICLLVSQRHILPLGATAGGVVLVGMAVTELLISSLADAVDVARHHLLFYAHCDVLLTVFVVLGTRAAVTAFHSRSGE